MPRLLGQKQKHHESTAACASPSDPLIPLSIIRKTWSTHNLLLRRLLLLLFIHIYRAHRRLSLPNIKLEQAHFVWAANSWLLPAADCVWPKNPSKIIMIIIIIKHQQQHWKDIAPSHDWAKQHQEDWAYVCCLLNPGHRAAALTNSLKGKQNMRPIKSRVETLWAFVFHGALSRIITLTMSQRNVCTYDAQTIVLKDYPLEGW